MELQDVIKSRRSELGLTLEQVANACGVGKSIVAKWERGEVKNIRRDNLISLADVLHISPLVLMGRDVDTAHSKKIPIYGEVRAGFPTTAVENIDGWEEIYPKYDDNTNYVFLRIKGDSMLPRMEEGDLALIDTDAKIQNGDVAVVLVNGDEATIKKVLFTDAGITLHAFNPYFPDINYTQEEVENLPVRFFGKVVETRAKF